MDELKIDKSLVAGLNADATDTAIVSSIIALGRSLHLTVVAEGIETPEQHDTLRELGCPWGPGWLWHRARPAAECDALLSGLSGGASDRSTWNGGSVTTSAQGRRV